MLEGAVSKVNLIPSSTELIPPSSPAPAVLVRTIVSNVVDIVKTASAFIGRPSPAVPDTVIDVA
jgi:hypothetical protein